MPKGLVNADSLAGIAAAIRVLNGSEELLKPAEMANAIMQAIPTETVSGDIAYITSAAPINAEDVAANIDLVQDLHGYDSPWPGGTGKNLLDSTKYLSSQTLNGVTMTVNNDGSIKFNGTASDLCVFNLYRLPKDGLFNSGSEYILNGCGGGSASTYKLDVFPSSIGGVAAATCYNNEDSQFVFDTNTVYDLRFVVYSGTVVNVTVYPMLRPSSRINPTFEPYSNICPITEHTSVDVTHTNKNCINFTAVTRTLNGVAMTVNAETGEVSLNGTAEANTIFEVGTIDLLKPGVNYILTGCPSGGGANTYRLAVPEPYWTYDDGAGRGFVHYKPVNTRSVRLIVQQGVSVENLVFKPMIRLAAETDSTFEKAANSVYKTVFGEIVYSGRFDLVKGELASDMAYEQMTYSYLSGLSSDHIGHSYTEANGNEIWVRNWNYDKAAPRRIGGIKAAGNMFQITSMHDTDRFASQNRIYFKVGEIDNVADFLQAVQTAEQNGGGLFVAYELAEPITYRLTPQNIKLFKGVNNVWCDTGEVVEVKYKVDLASYIDELKNATSSAKLSTASLQDSSPISLEGTAVVEPTGDILKAEEQM